MTETFRAVEPLKIGEYQAAAVAEQAVVVTLLFDTFTVKDARLLRDWLNCAIPCEHIFTHQRFNVQVCDDCGATLP